MLGAIEICGLRGFSANQVLEFAPARGANALGMTVIVGANNAGKTTIIEAMRALASNEAPSFPASRRNLVAGDKVRIAIRDTDQNEAVLESLICGTSEASYTKRDLRPLLNELFILPSRRTFGPQFGKGTLDRGGYAYANSFSRSRTPDLSEFGQRIFTIHANRDKFDPIIREVMGADFNWTIDLDDRDQWHLKVINAEGATHTSEGMGEGLISLMHIIDALYDSAPGHTIVIDEPELSLHPQYQRALLKLFLRYAEDRQIVISTHSPYFVEMGALGCGMRVHRVSSGPTGSQIHSLSPSTGIALSKFVTDTQNPHLTGLNTREVLFAGDAIALLEGQEDVIYLDRALGDVGRELDAYRFGWGVGGAGNMGRFARALQELGFRKVLGILDGDQTLIRDALRVEFPTYHFECQPASDIRTKSARNATGSVDGLLDAKNQHVRDEHRAEFIEMIDVANDYIRSR